MIPDPDLDPVENRIITPMDYGGVMILALDPDQESDFQSFSDSGSGLGSSK